MTQLTIDFYNTIEAPTAILQEYKERAAKQDQMVLHAFKELQLSLTPSELYDNLWKTHQNDLRKSPLTSIRRAICNLTKLGYLKKTKTKRTGPYGVAEYVWELKQ